MIDWSPFLVAIVGLFVVVLPPVINRYFAKRDAKELRDMTDAAAKLVAQAKVDLEENNRKVALAASTVATVAEETSAKVEAKLDRLATAEQLDGGLTMLIAQIEKRIVAAREEGFALGQKSIVDAAVARIETTLAAQDAVTASNERRDPSARTRAGEPQDVAEATAATVEAAQHADDLAKKTSS